MIVKRIDFEHGSIPSNILNAAIPMLVAQLLSLLYNIIDRIYIARIPHIGTTALGAVGLCFPNCVLNFTEEEWFGIYRDSKDYPVCFGVENATWEAAEKYLHTENCGKDVRNGEIIMPGGHLTVAQLTAMLNTIPMEITFVDEDNINRFFNEGPKDFKRPGMAIDREVFSCHPPKVEQQVRHIIGEFRKGTLDKVPIWMEKNGKTMLVTYMAVRDAAGTYLGTMELVQDMGFAKEHFLSDVKAKEAALRAGMED